MVLTARHAQQDPKPVGRGAISRSAQRGGVRLDGGTEVVSREVEIADGLVLNALPYREAGMS
jgi:hypothetical protein